MPHPIRRSIICELCKRPRQTQCRFDLCPACTHKLPKMRCNACNKMRFHPQQDSRLCYSCLRKLLSEKVTCVACGLRDFSFKADPTRCRKCHKKEALLEWRKSWSTIITCSSCGKEKQSWKKTGTTCFQCHQEQRCGNAKCLFTGCDKQASVQKSKLCPFHHEEKEAAESLRDYLDSYKSPFPQNERYLREVASEIVVIRRSDNFRLRAFGKFLQTYELPEVITWEAIEQALPPSGQRIRSSLLHLGDLYTERGKINDWSSHLHDRALRRVLDRTPHGFSKELSGFQQWLLGGSVNPNLQLALKTKPLAVAARRLVESTSLVARFLNFCATEGALSLRDITPALITKYQQTILWQFECKSCRKRIPFCSEQPKKCVKSSCAAPDSYVRRRHLTRVTLTSHMSVLRILFDWAKLKKVISENPMSFVVCSGAKTFTVRGENGEMVEVAEAIRRYDDIVVEKLCADIVSPEADPEQAMILYLIIFHSLTNSELRNLRIPSLMNMSSASLGTFPNSDDFEYLYLPLRQLSRGNRSVIREGTKIVFPRKARRFLKPILKRVYEKRTAKVKTQTQQHFLVGKENTFSNKPVARDYIRHRVIAASHRVLGGVVTAYDLRRTAADMFAQRSKCRGAILTKMGFSSLSATRFNYLERYSLQPKEIQIASVRN